ncbi:MAG TPA: DUF5685 family protein [Clostridia bacterium]|nr:DUF5685 family protein [Clostridia bacterium]
MFGYVKAYKPELKIKDYELYKGVYCSVCKQLGRVYGPFAQLTLSYDITFFAVLRMAARDKRPQFKKGHCTYNPMKKCNLVNADNDIAYSVDCAAIMLYYKVKDNIQDSKLLKSFGFRLLLPIVSLMHKKAMKRAPSAENIIKSAIDKQRDVEDNLSESIDEAAHPSAQALSKLISDGFEGDEKVVIERIGYLIGRWTYIIDAVDDLDDDRKNGTYNAIDLKYKGFETDGFKEQIKGMLNLTVDECLKAFELLDLKRFKDILNNILYLGLEETEKTVFGDERWCENEKEPV